jgi:tripartite-type tricarboxylate transporter receptor subunit TctC
MKRWIANRRLSDARKYIRLRAVNCVSSAREQPEVCMFVSRRRAFVSIAGSAAALAGGMSGAFALDYPIRPVHIVLGFPPGGSSDVIGRLIAQWLAKDLGQSFVFDNKPGAGSNIAAESVANATPDGYTLLFTTSANAINATLYRNLKFELTRDIAPIAGIFQVPNVLVVNPSVPFKSVLELIAYAKANPGKLNFASGGIGTTAHLSGEMFKHMTGIDMRHVPYRGSSHAMVDLLSGQVDLMFDLMPLSLGYIRVGKIRALAVTTKERSYALPDVPTVGEFVSGYEASTWNGMGAPKGTPTDVIAKLNKSINAGLAAPEIKARLVDLGATELTGTPDDFGRLIRGDAEKWAKVIELANVKAE